MTMAIWNTVPTTEIDPDALTSTDMLYLTYAMVRATSYNISNVELATPRSLE